MKTPEEIATECVAFIKFESKDVLLLMQSRIASVLQAYGDAKLGEAEKLMSGLGINAMNGDGGWHEDSEEKQAGRLEAFEFAENAIRALKSTAQAGGVKRKHVWERDEDVSVCQACGYVRSKRSDDVPEFCTPK